MVNDGQFDGIELGGEAFTLICEGHLLVNVLWLLGCGILPILQGNDSGEGVRFGEIEGRGAEHVVGGEGF